MESRKCYGLCAIGRLLENGSLDEDFRACGRDLTDLNKNGYFITSGHCPVKNKYYRPYLKMTLTDDGIVLTDGPNNDYIRTASNDSLVVQYLRKAISLYRDGNEDEFLVLCDEWYHHHNKKFLILEEGSLFGGTRILCDDGHYICIESILESISIRDSQLDLNPEGCMEIKRR
jgi:hypothetical protein